MKNPLLARILTLASALLSAGAVYSSTADHHLFHLNFDDGFHAQHARGQAQPLKTDALPLAIAGVDGQAATFAPGEVLAYAAEGNLNKSEGTISFWMKLPDQAPARSPGPWTLFSEKGPDDAGETRLKVEYFPGRFIRASIKDPRDSYVYFHGVDSWAPDQWHHVVLTWNIERGAIFYVDGLPVDTSWMPGWEPQTFEQFYIGAANAQGDEPARVAIDEFSIHGRELSETEVRDAFLSYGEFSVRVLIQDPFVSAEHPKNLAVYIANPAEEAKELTNLHFTLVNAEGAVEQAGKLSRQQIPGRQSATLAIPLRPADVGTYALRLTFRDADRDREAVSAVRFMSEKTSSIARAQAAGTTLVTAVNAVDQEPIAQSGGTRIVNSSSGTYREGGPNRHDRFAMHFDVEETNQPHLAVITYPDDKPRSMEVMLQNFGAMIDFQIHTGLFTGDEYPLSNDMLEHRVIFWPRTKRQAFIFMNVVDDFPSAVESIKVYRLNEFAVAARHGEFAGSVPARSSGLYYEDPVLSLNFGTDTGVDGFMEATDRLIEYMRSFGQTRLEYPLVWYGGPLYGTTVQPYEPDIDGGQGGNRPHPAGFPLYLLKELEANGMTFTAGLHLHTLPGLNDYAIVDQDRIAEGEETIINIRSDGKPWYGYWHGSDPNYNAGDPRVMESINAIVDEIIERYGQEPAFEGISLVIARPKAFSFGSIKSGYNDINLTRFQEDTGVTIPVYTAKDPQRYAKSYEWLMDNADAKEAWITWRTELLHTQYVAMADRLAAARPDLKLSLNVFVHYTNNTRIAEYLTEPSGVVMREMGIDPALYQDHPNIILDYTIIPGDLRWGRANMEDLPNHRVGRTVMTAPEMYASIRDHERIRMSLHDRYWEDPVGREAPLSGLSEIGVQEMVWRASTFHPGGHYSLEPYVLGLHHLDVGSIKKGGFVIGTFGMENELRAFSRAFQTLPAVKFDAVPEATDPVRVRQKVVDGKLYFYVLNTLPEALEASISLKEDGGVIEPATGTIHADARELRLAMAPYALHTFVSESPTQRVQGATTRLPESFLRDLEKRFRALIAAAEADETKSARYAPYSALAQEAWEAGHYSRIYYLLQEHWVSEILD